MLAAFAGDHTTVRAITDQMLQWALPRQVNTIVRFARQALCLSAIGRGDFEDAFREADSICSAGTLESHVPQSVWLLFDLVEAAVATGRHAEGAAHVRAMRDADVGRLSPRIALSAAGAAALVAQDDDAQTLFEDALAIPGAERYPFDLARVRLAYGQHLRRVRALPEAQVQLSTALDAFDRLGARPWAIRARNELRAAGRSQGGSAADAETMLNGLDLEIATLAASGLTNRQIGDRLYLSHRTVGARLHRIFPKLGITSRAALRDALENAPAK
jgi:ATP/maltotriose-dependent transcriptional regulator MalT